jgi:hypothetical protein
MRTWWIAGLALGMLGGGAALAGAPVPAARLVRVGSLTLRVTHRVFADFMEEDKVRMKEEFRIGDTDYTARVVEFVPDFTLDMKTGRVRSRSNELKNPAARIIVKQKGVPRDTSWAFLNFPPHFAAKNILAFQILRIEFPDHPPLVPHDSVTARSTRP